MRKLLQFLLLLTTLAAAGCSGANISIRETVNSKIAPGQVWTYRTRPGDAGSTLTILRVDAVTQKGVTTDVVHVMIENVHLNAGEGKSVLQVPFISFDEKALDSSLIRRVGILPKLPDFQSGYDRWVSDYRAGEDAVFTVPPAEALNQLQESLKSTPVK